MNSSMTFQLCARLPQKLAAADGGLLLRTRDIPRLQKKGYLSRDQWRQRRHLSNSSLLREDQKQDGTTKEAQKEVDETIEWEEDPDMSISKFADLPSSTFGYNQHMIIDQEFKEALRTILWQFKAPIRYAFAYGSGVFPQTAQSPSKSSTSVHPHPNKAIVDVQGGNGKMIDFIFGVSHTQHWHSLNLQQHRDHYSALGALGSGVVSKVQDNLGAGVYFNPFITVNGTLIKYGVVNLDTLCTDLSEWSTLYLAGRLQKPVKILRDDPRVRLANQINLISAVRTALLLLPETFTEKELYSTIAGISYRGDVRMSLPGENPNKVANIVDNQTTNFRRLYAPLIETLPNLRFAENKKSNDESWLLDPKANVRLTQDMDPQRRGNMVRRLPKSFREKFYFAYQSKFKIPRVEFDKMLEEATDEGAKGMSRRQGGVFEQRIARDEFPSLEKEVNGVIRQTIKWPSTVQTLKGIATGGLARSWRYAQEKRAKYSESSKPEKKSDERDDKKEK